MLLGLLEPTGGDVLFDGRPLYEMDRLARARRVQPIFPDPSSSLNPRKRIEDIVTLPLRVHKIGDRADWKSKAAERMDLVGVARSYLSSEERRGGKEWVQ